MREILFRGRRTDNGEFAYGDLIRYSDKMALIVSNIVEKKAYKVNPKTIGQYIGLTDKNGVKIFEGDVVSVWGGENCQGYWEYSDVIEIKDMVCDAFTISEVENVEVIGDVCDK